MESRESSRKEAPSPTSCRFWSYPRGELRWSETVRSSRSDFILRRGYRKVTASSWSASWGEDEPHAGRISECRIREAPPGRRQLRLESPPGNWEVSLGASHAGGAGCLRRRHRHRCRETGGPLEAGPRIAPGFHRSPALPA